MNVPWLEGYIYLVFIIRSLRTLFTPSTPAAIIPALCFIFENRQNRSTALDLYMFYFYGKSRSPQLVNQTGFHLGSSR